MTNADLKQLIRQRYQQATKDGTLDRLKVVVAELGTTSEVLSIRDQPVKDLRVGQVKASLIVDETNPWKPRLRRLSVFFGQHIVCSTRDRQSSGDDFALFVPG